ncbi:hypothetical protein FSP39_007962 [Pinctada imbricata]|uniref:WD repeat protein mio zinc-ribbon like domain-containing protein n=1 Tax=Pinctada imbricata TaxID=66713 RepID=A0AA88YX18_PINIB|nr:hypothetical protein FSP39_007962 [Pinctada imbricata]
MAEAHRQSKVQTKNNIGRYIGVRVLLGLDSDVRPGSSPEYMAWVTSDGSLRNRLLVRQYTNEERGKALQLCGWGDRMNKDSVDKVIYFLQKNNEFTKAAALALFNLEITRAIDILSNSASYSLDDGDNSNSTVAMALAGYTEERQTLWRKTCTSLLRTLEDPYLRAMFIFLAGDRENFDDILKDPKGMMLADKVAFACIYLNDDKLNEYVDSMSKKLTSEGNLDGMLLTGLTSEGVELLQRYVDITGDIQTASLAAIYSFPCDSSRDERVRNWIELYRELLDRWRLWHHRAKFDIIRHANDTVRVTSQSFVSCNFCGKSIACNMSVASRSRPFMSSSMPLSSMKPKITCCPGCRKPLPRCSLCLTNLGTPSGSALYQQKEKSDFKNVLSPVNDWFAWCQNCRHGGHSMHLTQWFKEHSECPVTGCECKCATLDYTGRLATIQMADRAAV